MALSVTDYRSAIDALFARTGGHIKPGLTRTEALLRALGDPQHTYPSFHVAGTNGKGSVCAMLDALLQSRGFRVGRYTSPHLIDFTERILVNGAPISPEHVVSGLRAIEPHVTALGDEATFFEITTVLAFWFFAQANVDVAVIETGLGGRLDSTNVLRPLVATVTNIGRDHMEYLGETLQEIADEKAGIFKAGIPAVIGEPRADLARRMADRAAEVGAGPVTLVRDLWRSWSVALNGTKTSFMANTPLGQARLTTPLYGEHQVGNTLTALATLASAGPSYMVPLSEVSNALAGTSLPGRFQRVGEWIFDVAHNGPGARALAEALGATTVARPLTALVGVLKDKDWQSVLDALAPLVNRFIITQPRSAPANRAWDPMAAGVYANKLGVPVTYETDFATAVQRAQEQPGTKLVTGSFHTVGDVMQQLEIQPIPGVRA